MWQSFRHAVAKARRHDDLVFACLLSEDHIHNALGEARLFWQGWIYTPAVTVWGFLSRNVLSQDHSCRDAVARLIAWRVARGQSPCSADTGAYCTARTDLPEEACQQLVRDTGKAVEAESPDVWLWHGRRVRVLDGSTITMPDTEANQAEYPQPMDHLRCKRPERVRNVFCMHLIGYNLIRRAIAVAAFESGASPWSISFKGSLQTLMSLLPLLDAKVHTDTWCETLIAAVSTHLVGNRPDRYEPRLVKRRKHKGVRNEWHCHLIACARIGLGLGRGSF